MSGSEMLVRLRDLRRLRERRAEERLARSRAAAQEATRRSGEAAAAAEAQRHEAAAEEYALLEALKGRPVSLLDLDRVQAFAEAAAQEQAKLADQEERAREHERGRARELKRARQARLSRARAAAKLVAALERDTAGSARRRTALAELAEEEDFTASRAAPGRARD